MIRTAVQHRQIALPHRCCYQNWGLRYSHQLLYQYYYHLLKPVQQLHDLLVPGCLLIHFHLGSEPHLICQSLFPYLNFLQHLYSDLEIECCDPRCFRRLHQDSRLFHLSRYQPLMSQWLLLIQIPRLYQEFQLPLLIQIPYQALTPQSLPLNWFPRLYQEFQLLHLNLFLPLQPAVAVLPPVRLLHCHPIRKNYPLPLPSGLYNHQFGNEM